MTAQFWQHQLDYVFFFYGLAFILLLPICVILHYRKENSLPWLLLGLFGAVHGVNEWLEMLALSLGDTEAFAAFRNVVTALSFVLLTEFGLRGWTKRKSASLIHVPLLAISFAGCLAGYSGFNATVRYSFAMCGGLLSSFALLQFSGKRKTAGNSLTAAAVVMAFYSLASGVVVPAASFFPASFVNQDSFFGTTGIPIQLVRGVLLVCFSAAIWNYHQKTRRDFHFEDGTFPRKSQFLRPTAVLLTVLSVGWLFTEYVGKSAANNTIEGMVRQVEIAAAAINPDRVRNVIESRPHPNGDDHARLRCQLEGVAAVDSQLIGLCLMPAGKPGTPCTVEAAPANLVANPPARHARLPSAGSDLTALQHSVAIGPYDDGNGNCLSVFTPVRDAAAMRTIAVLGVDFAADNWQTTIAGKRMMPIGITLLISLLFISFHMSRQKDLELARRIAASENQLLEAQAIAHLGSWEIDLESDREYRSAEFFRLLGYPVRTTGLAHDSVLEYVHPDDRENVEKKIAETLTGGRPYDAEFRIVRQDGSERIVHARGKTIDDGTGKVARFIGTILDITERRNLEAQLYQAQKMEAVGQLAGGIAHDFNNILTAIMGYSYLLSQDLAGHETANEHISQIMMASERAAELTQGLLAFSRKQVMMSKLIDLNGVVGQWEKMLRRLISENVELAVKTTGEELTVIADRGKIEQVLMNLVTNAKDAMDDGGMLVISTAGVTMGNEFIREHGYGVPGEYVCIGVSDTGCGMSEETRKRVFEPFFTTKEVGKGTGLGLSIAYGIVKQHNGYIDLESEPGRGTTFRIYLPRVDSRVAEMNMQTSETALRGGSETLLLAEDDAFVCTFHRTILAKSGYKVVVATDGEDALEKFAAHEDQIDLLILDIVMPKKNGNAVYDQIRERKPGIKVLFMSGYSAENFREVGIARAQVGFMAKPVKTEELLKKVREILDPGGSGV